MIIPTGVDFDSVRMSADSPASRRESAGQTREIGNATDSVGAAAEPAATESASSPKTAGHSAHGGRSGAVQLREKPFDLGLNATTVTNEHHSRRAANDAQTVRSRAAASSKRRPGVGGDHRGDPGGQFLFGPLFDPVRAYDRGISLRAGDG